MKLLQQIPAHQGSVYALYQSPNADFFFSASGDGTVIQWNFSNPENAKIVAKVSANIYSLAFIPESELLLIGQIHGGLHVVSLKEKKEVRHLAFHQNGIFDIHVRNKMVYLAGGDGVLSIWKENDFSPVKALKISDKSIRSIDFHPNRDELAIGTSDHSIYIVNSKTGEVIHTLNQHKNSVFKVKYSPDGKLLLSGSRDAHLGVWNAESNYDLTEYIPAHNYTINDICFHPDGNLFATASRDKSIKIWNTANRSFITKLDKSSGGHLNSVNKLLWLRDGLISCSDDRSLIFWLKEQEILNLNKA